MTMNSVIWKVQLEKTGAQKVKMGRGAQILTAGNQFEQLCIWFKHDPTESMEDRIIEVYGTGHTIKDNVPGGELKFVSTVQMSDGALIWHVFERVSVQL